MLNSKTAMFWFAIQPAPAAGLLCDVPAFVCLGAAVLELTPPLPVELDTVGAVVGVAEELPPLEELEPKMVAIPELGSVIPLTVALEWCAKD